MISLAVMAHPSRTVWAEALGNELDAPVVYDVDSVEWNTGRRALLEFDPDAEWHVVVQDDAILCADFRSTVEAALAHVPVGLPVGLYVGRVRPQHRLVERAVAAAQRAGTSWLEWHEGPRWGVGVAIPTAHVELLVREADADPHPHYDARLRRFYKRANVSTRYPLPSLVDHRPAAENPSLICSENADRRAHAFAGDNVDVDWATPPLVIDRRGRFGVLETA